VTISLQKALGLVQRALEAGQAQSVGIVAVVVDLGGHPVAAARMDGVSFINTEVAQRKATLAAAFGTPTHQLQAMIGKDPIAGPIVSADQRISLLPGGLPILEEGRCIGGLGIAGGHYLQDQAVGEYAIAR